MLKDIIDRLETAAGYVIKDHANLMREAADLIYRLRINAIDHAIRVAESTACGLSSRADEYREEEDEEKFLRYADQSQGARCVASALRVLRNRQNPEPPPEAP